MRVVIGRRQESTFEALSRASFIFPSAHHHHHHPFTTTHRPTTPSYDLFLPVILRADHPSLHTHTHSHIRHNGKGGVQGRYVYFLPRDADIYRESTVAMRVK